MRHGGGAPPGPPTPPLLRWNSSTRSENELMAACYCRCVMPLHSHQETIHSAYM